MKILANGSATLVPVAVEEIFRENERSPVPNLLKQMNHTGNQVYPVKVSSMHHSLSESHQIEGLLCKGW